MKKMLHKCDPVRLFTVVIAYIFRLQKRGRKMTSNIAERLGIALALVLVYLWRDAFWYIVLPIMGFLAYRDIISLFIFDFDICGKCERIKELSKGTVKEISPACPNSFICHECDKRYAAIIAQANELSARTDALYGQVLARKLDQKERPRVERVFTPPRDVLDKISPSK